MRDDRTPRRVTSVVASLSAGGIGPVCRYAALGIARRTDWRVTLLSLHDPPAECVDESSGLRTVCLGLGPDCAQLFLQWLANNPQDIIVTSDVSRIEAAFPFVPATTRHVVQVHDSGRAYRAAALRNSKWVDGITCVANHIEESLRRSLDITGFRGLLRTVHNGADFPPTGAQRAHDGPLRLLFMGRMDPFKGIFDLVPLLKHLQRMRVPATLTIVGGEHEQLARTFHRERVDHLVNWAGRVPHDECYQVAAEHDILLMLSRKEPFGMVTIEAMAMGCVPMAYNSRSGSAEIIEDGKSGLLIPLGELWTWAKTIAELDVSRQRLAQLSTAAMHRAREHFDAERMSRNLATFLTDVMAHAARSPAKRENGVKPKAPVGCAERRRVYQRLPARLRGWIRNQVGKYPRLCHWWLDR